MSSLVLHRCVLHLAGNSEALVASLEVKRKTNNKSPSTQVELQTPNAAVTGQQPAFGFEALGTGSVFSTGSLCGAPVVASVFTATAAASTTTSAAAADAKKEPLTGEFGFSPGISSAKGGVVAAHSALWSTPAPATTTRAPFLVDSSPADMAQTVSAAPAASAVTDAMTVQSSLLKTTWSSKVEVVVALGDADAHRAQIAAKAVGDHCDQGQAERQAYEAAGVIPPLLTAMTIHRAHAGTQEQLCYAVRKLAMSDTAKNELGFAGGIVSILQALKEHQTHVGVVEWACAALSRLVVDNTVNQRSVREVGGITAVVIAMMDHALHPGVALQAGYTLAFLACGNIDNQEAIVQAGGIAAIMRVMELQPDAKEVQSIACRILDWLIVNAANKDAFSIVKGPCSTLVAAVRTKHYFNYDNMQGKTTLDFLGKL
jgi:hypothetical protein